LFSIRVGGSAWPQANRTQCSVFDDIRVSRFRQRLAALKSKFSSTGGNLQTSFAELRRCVKDVSLNLTGWPEIALAAGQNLSSQIFMVLLSIPHLPEDQKQS